MQNIQPTSVGSMPPAGVAASDVAVSWGAIFAGAVIAMATSAMLVTGGTGLGFLSMSPWQDEGASGEALAIGTVLWLLFSQIVAYGLGGYVAGRLRAKWHDAPGHEVHFRDTAHGFAVWALSALVAMTLLGSTVASVVSGTAKMGAQLAGAGAGAMTAAVGGAAAGGAASGDGMPSMDYFTDALLRPDTPSPATGQGDVRQEVSRILTRSATRGELTEADRNYLVKLISQRTGVDEAAAQQRIKQIADEVRKTVDETAQKAREAADTARKAAAAFALWAFASLLVGAFVSIFAAAMGGRARERSF